MNTCVLLQGVSSAKPCALHAKPSFAPVVRHARKPQLRVVRPWPCHEVTLPHQRQTRNHQTCTFIDRRSFIAVPGLKPELRAGIECKMAARIDTTVMPLHALKQARHITRADVNIGAKSIGVCKQPDVPARFDSQCQRIGFCIGGKVRAAGPNTRIDHFGEIGNGRCGRKSTVECRDRFNQFQIVAAIAAHRQSCVMPGSTHQRLRPIGRAEHAGVQQKALQQFGTARKVSCVTVCQKQVAACPERQVRFLRHMARPVLHAEKRHCVSEVRTTGLIVRELVE